MNRRMNVTSNLKVDWSLHGRLLFSSPSVRLRAKHRSQYSVRLGHGKAECYAHFFHGSAIGRANSCSGGLRNYCHANCGSPHFIYFDSPAGGKEKCLTLKKCACTFCFAPWIHAGHRRAKQNSMLSAPLVGTCAPLPAPHVPPGRLREGAVQY